MDFAFMRQLAEGERPSYVGKTPKKLAGTRVKLKAKRLLRKAGTLSGRIQSRASSSQRKIRQRQTKGKRYHSVPAFLRKTRFLRRGESLEALCRKARVLLDVMDGRSSDWKTDDGHKGEEKGSEDFERRF